MSEPDGSPSNNRVMLFLFLTTVVLIVMGASISPNLSIKIVIPVIPESFGDLVKWITVILVSGGAAGKAADAYSKARTGGTTTTSTSTVTVADKKKEGEV